MVRYVCATLLIAAAVSWAADRPVWPPSPDRARVEAVTEIKLADLEPRQGLFGRLARFIGGRSESESISLPFDVKLSGSNLYAVCQGLPALVEIDLKKGQFRLYADEGKTMRYPLTLCRGEEDKIYVSDGEARTVYEFANGQIRPFIADGLVRPTGVAWLSATKRLVIVDTGEQAIKLYDSEGNLIKRLGNSDSEKWNLNYPTFTQALATGQFVVNDALNFELKTFDFEGNFQGAFGKEGDGPGCFARPKGIAADSEGHLYVVDNLFDNVQVFNSSGQLLLVIGAAGQSLGQFWSPAGIDIVRDTIYIADTFNDRIQVLRYLGDSQ